MAEDPDGPFVLPDRWVHADEAPSWSDLAGQASAFVRWRFDDWASLERLHALDRAARGTEEAIGVLGLHAGPLSSSQRVRDVLLARGAWAPTGLPAAEDDPIPETGAVALVAGGELVGTFDPSTPEDRILEALSEHAGSGTPWRPRGEAPGPWPLAFPFDVAVGGSRLAVADTGHNRVLVARPGGEIVHLVGDGVPEHVDGSLRQARFEAPRGVCWHGETLLVADTGNDAIRSVDPTRDEVTTLARAPEGSLPAGLARTSDGDTVVALAAEGHLVHLEDDGLAPVPDGQEAFGHPVDVEPADEGLLVADLDGSRVVRLDGDGATVVWKGDPLVEPSGLLADAPPRIADPSAGTVIELPGGDGEPRDVLDGVPGLSSPTAVDREADRLVVADGGGHHLWRFEEMAADPLSRVRLTESPLSLAEHIRLDPVELAPGGRLTLSISYILPEHGSAPDEFAPPTGRGPVRDLALEGEPVRDPKRIRVEMAGRVAASGNLRIRWSLTETGVGHAAAWDLPIVVRPGAEDDLRLALSTSPP